MQTLNNQYVPIIPLYWGDWVTPAGEPVHWPRSWNEKNKTTTKKNINVTVPVKFDTRQLSIQHVLLVKVRTTRQIWRNLGVLSSAVGVTRDFYAWQFNFNASLSWHYELKPGPTKHNNNNNALQRQHKPRPATRHFHEEYCQVTSKLKHYELQPRPATHKPKYYVNNRANSRTHLSRQRCWVKPEYWKVDQPKKRTNKLEET